MLCLPKRFPFSVNTPISQTSSDAAWGRPWEDFWPELLAGDGALRPVLCPSFTDDEMNYQVILRTIAFCRSLRSHHSIQDALIVEPNPARIHQIKAPKNRLFGHNHIDGHNILALISASECGSRHN